MKLNVHLLDQHVAILERSSNTPYFFGVETLRG